MLSVKPQILPKVLDEIAPHLKPSALVISIAAGVPVSAIEPRLPEGTRVVRTMPNTPALVGAGATAIAAGEHAKDDDVEATQPHLRRSRNDGGARRVAARRGDRPVRLGAGVRLPHHRGARRTRA